MHARIDNLPMDQLNERELTVFRFLARGLTHAEAADELQVHPRTISATCLAIREKLSMKSSLDLWRLTRKYLLVDE